MPTRYVYTWYAVIDGCSLYMVRYWPDGDTYTATDGPSDCHMIVVLS